MVGVAPYEHEGHNYNALNIIVAYRKGQGFVISWQPVQKTDRGYITGPMPSRDPLVGVGCFVAKQASRNNVKMLEQMRTNMEVAKEGVKFYFDQRDFDALKTFMGDVANYGYTADKENEIKNLINSKSTVMANIQTNNESNNVQNNAQVSNHESPMMKQFKQLKEKHPGAMLLFRCGDFYETYEDDAKAASEVLGITLTKSTKTGVQMAGFPYHALDTYLPKLIKAGKRVAICDQLEAPSNSPSRGEQKTPKEDKAVTVPLGEHGTLVIGKPGFSTRPAEDAVAEEIKDETPKAAPKKVTLKKKQKPESEPVDVSVPSATSVPSVLEFSTYKTKKGNTAPQIIGFSGEDDPRWKRHEGGVHKWVSASWYKDVSGEKKYRLQFGTRYMDAAKALCDAYNSGDAKAIAKAEADCQAEHEQSQAEGKARWEAKKAEWAAKKAAKNSPTPEKEETKGYDDKDVAEMLKAIMAGGDIPENIKRHMKAA